ncbi:hypothetical protein BTK_04260 [Bacillus thuringiensis serovar kurstaki str. HD-1]|nr:hypothetical protein BTK_04260 [Bacillus thuringiensis serovar kurstaki str. HD-1]
MIAQGLAEFVHTSLEYETWDLIQPCQGWGRGFESRTGHTKKSQHYAGSFLFC